jgi:hypothetical protein
MALHTANTGQTVRPIGTIVDDAVLVMGAMQIHFSMEHDYDDDYRNSLE